MIDGFGKIGVIDGFGWIGGIGGLKPTLQPTTLQNTLRRTLRNPRNTLQIRTETDTPSFPRKRESRPFGTETYRINGFSRFRILDSRLRGNDGSGIFIRQIRKVRHRVG